MSTLSPRDKTAQEARAKAQEVLAKIKLRDAEALKESRKAQLAEDQKTDRLRALRLAKEAADKDAALKSALAAEAKAANRKRFDSARQKAAAE